MFEKLGKFEIRRTLGQGAMGEVYLGVDPSIGREVAIKTILPSAAAGPDANERFAREAKAAGVLNHPNLVTIYEFGEDQGVMFIAMEFVKGHDLEELMRDQSLTRSESLEVLAQVCDGLAFAHRNHIVHRDIKPSNVRVTRDGKRIHAKVMDFGVARVGNSEMTATGMVMGTVSYMAPEYIRTGKPDPRSDLFAVGVMLYECLSGRKPFSGDTTPTILYKIVNEPPAPIDLSQLQGISPLIRTVLDRSLDKDPDLRYQGAEDLAKALRAAKDPTWQGHVQEGTALLPSAAATAQVPASGGAADPTVLQSAVPATAVLPSPAALAAGGGAPVPPRPAAKSGSGVGIILGVIVLLGLGVMGVGGYTYWRWKKGQEVPPPVASTTLENTVPAAGAELPAVNPANPQPQSPTSDSQNPATTGERPALPKGSGSREPRTGGGSQARGGRDSGEDSRPADPPPARVSNDPFARENLEKLDAPQRKNLAMTTLSEATSLIDSQPEKALGLLRNSIAANPNEVRPYAWAVVVLYRMERFQECRDVLNRAASRGIGVGQLSSSNSRFKKLMDDESFNHKIPGGRDY
jgi:serine/threonine-protein kinase